MGSEHTGRLPPQRNNNICHLFKCLKRPTVCLSFPDRDYCLSEAKAETVSHCYIPAKRWMVGSARSADWFSCLSLFRFTSLYLNFNCPVYSSFLLCMGRAYWWRWTGQWMTVTGLYKKGAKKSKDRNTKDRARVSSRLRNKNKNLLKVKNPSWKWRESSRKSEFVLRLKE